MSLCLFSFFGWFHLHSTPLAWAVMVISMMVFWAGIRLFSASHSGVTLGSLFYWLCPLSILFFQVSQRILLAAQVPNEERSLLIFGAEFHHIYSGLILIFASYGAPRTRAGNASFFLGCGFVFDQVWYAAIGMQDETNYFSTANLVCAVLLAAFLFPLHRRTVRKTSSI